MAKKKGTYGVLLSDNVKNDFSFIIAKLLEIQYTGKYNIHKEKDYIVSNVSDYSITVSTNNTTKKIEFSAVYETEKNTHKLSEL